MINKITTNDEQCIQVHRQSQACMDEAVLLNSNAQSEARSHAAHCGEIADENVRPRRHRAVDTASGDAARKKTDLSSTDRHAVVGWLKNNAPAWLLGMLGLLSPVAVKAQEPSEPSHDASAFGVAAAQHASAQAAEVLASDVRLWQNRIYLATDDLHDIVAHPSQHPPATVGAAQTMLDYPDEFRKADGANTAGSVDGQIWKRDLIVYAKNVRASQAHAASSKGIPTDEQALSHFMQLALEAAALRTQQARSASLQATQVRNDTAMVEARQTLLDDAALWKGKSTLSAADLHKVLSDPIAHPPQTVVASLFMLQHPEYFKHANDFKRDNNLTDIFSQSAAVLPKVPLDTTALSDSGPEAIAAMKILLNDASLWVGKNGNTAQDLQNVVDHPELNAPDTVAAATFLLQHPGTFKIADGLASGGAIDGQIWKRDLVAAIDQANAAPPAPSFHGAIDREALMAKVLKDLGTIAPFGRFGSIPAADDPSPADPFADPTEA